MKCPRTAAAPRNRGAAALLVPHGFRSSFRDWAAKRTTHPREVAAPRPARPSRPGRAGSSSSARPAWCLRAPAQACRRRGGEQIASRLTGHSGRVGLASALTASGASTTDAMLAATTAPAGHLQPRVTPESMGPIGAHHMDFPSKENPNPTIPVARVLGRQTTHRGQRRGIPHGQSRLVAQRRPCHREHGARAAVGQTA